MRSIRCLAATIGMTIILPALLSAQCDNCKWPTATQPESLVVDANTGKVLEGRTEFPSDTQIELVIVNKNPYKYTYKVSIAEQNLELDLIGKALEQLAIPLSSSDSGDSNVMRGLALAQLSFCTGPSKEKIKKVAALAQELTAANDAVIEGLDAIPDAAKKFNGFLAGIQTDTTTIDQCKARCTQARDLGTDLDLLDGTTLSILMDQLDSTIAKLQSGIKTLQGDSEVSSQAGCPGLVAALDDQLTAARNNRTSLADRISSHSELAKKAAAAKKVLKDIAADAEAFNSVRYLPALEAATKFTITIVRKDRETDAETSVTVVVTAGRSRFTVSGGIAVGFVGERSFKTQNGIVPDGQGGTKAGSVFAIDDEKNETLTPSIQLNGTIYSWPQVKFGWSLGLMTLSEDTDTSLGYFTGPSFSFIGGHLFFTLGYYRQKVDSLDGYEVGDPVPASLTGLPPTSSKTKGGLLLSVSYRIR